MHKNPWKMDSFSNNNRYFVKKERKWTSSAIFTTTMSKLILKIKERTQSIRDLVKFLLYQYSDLNTKE